jgi:hypothetical protein
MMWDVSSTFFLGNAFHPIYIHTLYSWSYTYTQICMSTPFLCHVYVDIDRPSRSWAASSAHARPWAAPWRAPFAPCPLASALPRRWGRCRGPCSAPWRCLGPLGASDGGNRWEPTWRGNQQKDGNSSAKNVMQLRQIMGKLGSMI